MAPSLYTGCRPCHSIQSHSYQIAFQDLVKVLAPFRMQCCLHHIFTSLLGRGAQSVFGTRLELGAVLSYVERALTGMTMATEVATLHAGLCQWHCVCGSERLH